MLQIDCLISPLYRYVSTTLLLHSPKIAIELASQFELSKAGDGKTLCEHIRGTLRRGELYTDKLIEKKDSKVWKALDESLAAPGSNLQQFLPLISDTALSVPQVVCSIMKWLQSGNAADTDVEMLKNLWKRLRKSISPAEAQILLDYLKMQDFSRLNHPLKDVVFQLYNMLISAKHSSAQSIIVPMDVTFASSNDWTRLKKKQFGDIASQRSSRFSFKWQMGRDPRCRIIKKTAPSGQTYYQRMPSSVKGGDLEILADDSINPGRGYWAVVGCLRNSENWDKSPVLITRAQPISRLSRSARFEGVLDTWKADPTLHHKVTDKGGPALLLYIGVYCKDVLNGSESAP